MHTEQAALMRVMQTFTSSKGYLRQPINPPIQDASPSHLVARAVRRPSAVRTEQLNRDAIGGAYRDRTDDPLLAKQVLSQLS